MNPAPFQHLWLLLQHNRPVAVHSHLIRLTGNAKSAVFLSQLVYWTRRSPLAQDSAGWVHKTAEQWFRELGLTRREQDSARAALKGLEVLEEAWCGQPAQRCYRLRLPQLGRLLCARLSLPAAEFDLDTFCTNEALMAELLGKALPYHRTLAHLTGSVNAALLLTRVIFQHRRHLHVEGWFLLSRIEVERDLGLTRWELEGARRCLRGKRFVEERLANLPARIYARAVPPEILNALRQLDQRMAAGDATPGPDGKNANQITGIPASLPEEKRQADSRDSRHPGWRKTSNLAGGKPQTWLAENLQLSKQETTEVNLTTEKLTTTTTAAPRDAAAAVASAEVVVVDEKDLTGVRQTSGCLTVRTSAPPARHASADPPEPATAGSSLQFPGDFLPAERELAAAELATLSAERAQLVLDELEGRSRKGRSVHTRVGLVRSLAEAERQGRFTPAYAWEVRAAREREAQRQAGRRAREEQHRAETEILRSRLAACTEGKTGYEAFKALTARLRRTHTPAPRSPNAREGTV